MDSLSQNAGSGVDNNNKHRRGRRKNTVPVKCSVSNIIDACESFHNEDIESNDRSINCPPKSLHNLELGKCISSTNPYEGGGDFVDEVNYAMDAGDMDMKQEVNTSYPVELMNRGDWSININDWSMFCEEVEKSKLGVMNVNVNDPTDDHCNDSRNSFCGQVIPKNETQESATKSVKNTILDNCQSSINELTDTCGQSVDLLVDGEHVRVVRAEEELASSVAIDVEYAVSPTPRAVYNNKMHYRCFECSYVTDEIPEFKIHLKTHGDDTEMFYCAVCDISFSKEMFLKHMKIHPKGNYAKSFTCNLCDACYRSAPGLEAHMRTAHTVVCRYCDVTFTTIKDLLIHVKVHETAQSRKCPKAHPYSDKQGSSILVNENIMTPGRERYQSTGATSQKMKNQKTKNCPGSVLPNDDIYTASTSSTVAVQAKSQRKRRSFNKTFICIHCSMVFTYKLSFLKHLKRHREFKKMEHKKLPKDLICQFCGSDFTYKQSWLKHLQKCCQNHDCTETESTNIDTTFDEPSGKNDCPLEDIKIEVEAISPQDAAGEGQDD